AIELVTEPMELTVVAQELPHGVALTAQLETAPFGISQFHIRDSQGQRLPAWLEYEAGQPRWFVPRAALNSGTIQVIAQAGGQQAQVDVAVDATRQAAIAELRPGAGQTLTQGALVPVMTKAASNARTSTQSFEVSGSTQPLALTAQDAFGWLQVPLEDTSLAWSHLVEGVPQGQQTLMLAANNAEAATVTMLAPQHNSTARAGDQLVVQYRATDASNDAFRFAELALFDFNRNLLTRVLLQDSDGTASLRLPAVTAKDTFYVRVRGYWGD